MILTTLIAALFLLASTSVALPNSLNTRSGKPTGGPASTAITIYDAYTCTSLTSPPPTDGSAGHSTTVTIAETQCAILNIPLGGAITATLTANPKTGTAGCYVQIFTQSGCGVTLQNQYHGYPFDGVAVGNKVGCVAPFGVPYGAVEVVCE